MKKIALEEILLPKQYELKRPKILPEIIQYKKSRRLILGEMMSLIFENHRTLWFQVQEMVRVERMEDPELIREELNVYNALLPEKGQLSATLFIEITDTKRMLDELSRFKGIEDGECISLEFQPGSGIVGIFDMLYRNPNKVSSVYFLKFNIPEDSVIKVSDPNIALHLVVNHPNYYVRAQVPMELRRQLGEELIM